MLHTVSETPETRKLFTVSAGANNNTLQDTSSANNDILPEAGRNKSNKALLGMPGHCGRSGSDTAPIESKEEQVARYTAELLREKVSTVTLPLGPKVDIMSLSKRIKNLFDAMSSHTIVTRTFNREEVHTMGSGEKRLMVRKGGR